MASRRADPSRSYHDDRGGGRYSAPRRDDRRDRDRERDRDRDRDSYRDDRRGDRRDGRRRDDRRRDDRRDRDSYRRRSRSRSPPRRDRSRDGYRADRRYGRDDRYNGRDEYRARDDGRLHNSNSGTPAADTRPVSRSSNLSRDDRRREEEKQKQKDAEVAEKTKLEKLENWKRKQLEKKQAQKQADSPAADASPATTAPATPAVASAPSASEAKKEPVKTKASTKSIAELKPKQVKEFKLDHSAATRPAQFKSATKPNGTVVANRANGQFSKTGGNIGALSLKTKSAKDEVAPIKKGLLDDQENTGKRSLQALPDFTPLDGEDAAADADEEDATIGEIGDDDEAQLRARLEERREKLANEDTIMEEAPTADESVEKMDVDDATGAQEDEIDPLDAFMAELPDAAPIRPAFRGQAMFGDDNEPEATAVDGEDLMALTSSKKKKKEITKVDHDKVEYEPFRKDFYTEPVEVSQMTPEEVADLRLELDGIKVKPEDNTVPRPVVKWAQMGLLQQTMDVFVKVRYEKPTPIQAQAIPIAESGMDLIGVAKTGSGKTLAFGIPMIRHVLDQRKLSSSDGPIGLILAPTRELSQQIVSELKPFLKASGLHIACAYGGPPISEQIAMLKRGGIHVLCATPGRLIELLTSNSGRVLNFRRVTYVVLDEADRMFDMGFEPQVMTILNNIRPDRQAILFSATFPKNMAALARKALTNPVEVTIGGRSVVAAEVDQIVKLVPNSLEAKMKELLRTLGVLFQDNENSQVLIFVERQETAEDLLSKLIKAKYSAVNTIHGAKDQTDRTEAINDFRQGDLPVLIATSVAARGLDVPNLAMVFNFDCPTHLEDYVHRCGRTGRAGKEGKAITLVENPGQERFAAYIVKALRASGRNVPSDLQKIAEDFNHKLKTGEEKWYDPGFGGKGLDKLDAARAMEKRREKRAHRIEGEEVSDDELELPGAKTTETATTKDGKSEEDEQPSYMKILNSNIIVNKTERPAPGPTKPMTAKERAMAAANKVDGRLSKKGMIHHGQPIDNKGPDAGLFHATVEINDFPQEARWAVTNRTNVVKLLDSTGVSITTKGTYYSEGKGPKEEGDLPKLYVLVEGDTENAVSTAMRGLHGYLADGIKTHLEKAAARGPTGRYSVI
ncbi:P-loop containing nucleoside triphosphate hydrolase protein [Lentithecium fluviatile CBS 122367]|uniref:RNA helicase n=1 Tax=Lentithecium fluviatile CBS 122367 TaxID=1168545 RepID=A0A6G1JKW6_9PLEO|nr:P-loop containing nucleoside triphosphate hydrolase protein [Lentithecium fluviatile CBS 122367]